MTADAKSITELLTLASSQVISAPGRDPWDYGWYLRKYRHSEAAALSGPEGPVTIVGEGLTAWENAAEELLREKRIKTRWDSEEFWGLLASLVVSASSLKDPPAFLARRVDLLRTIGPSLTIQLVANVTWDRDALDFGDIIIGDADMKFLQFVNERARKRPNVGDEVGRSWLDDRVKPRMREEDEALPVAMACWSVGQMTLADRNAQRQLRNLVDLSLLLEHDPKSHKIYQRGETNRPGIRGLTLDRGAVERGLVDSAKLELVAVPLSVSLLNPNQRKARWYGPEPFPLGRLLSQEYLHNAVMSCLKQNPISNRIQVAARWFAEAHYTAASDDAALALGVAMDAMLTGQRALPGTAMADRFALLTDDPRQRRELVSTYLDFYKVRSSVAHGGRSSRLDQGSFLDEYRASVRWAAWRLLALRDTFTPSSENEVDNLFDELRWGMRAWR